MKFKNAESLQTVVEDVRRADVVRGRNRARINTLFNGEQPYTSQEAEENNIGTNVNFLEATNIAHGARAMYDRGFVDLEKFFDVTVDYGPIHKRGDWGQYITTWINRYLRRTPAYRDLQTQKFADVVLHGPGMATWARPDHILPKFAPVCEILFPNRTLRDMSNLSYFQIYREMTAAELTKMATGPVRKGWNMRLVEQLIREKNNEKMESGSQGQDWMFPEKLAEDIKADSGVYTNSSVPKIRTWDVYFLNDDDEPQWNRRIVVAEESGDSTMANSEYLFDPGDKSYGTDYKRLFSSNYADGCNVAPFRWHSMRSLGFLLYATAHLANRLRCRVFDAAFRETLTLFRNVGEGDRDRLQLIDLHDYGVIPEGLNMVTAAERNQVNVPLLAAVQGQARQLMAENSAHFSNDIDDGTNRGDKTATQIIAESQASNALVGAMLAHAHAQEVYQDLEICRRLCTSPHPDAKRFRNTMMSLGIPREMLNVEMWDVARVREIGNGHKVMQMAQADKLMQAYPLFDPQAQRKILRLFTSATVDDPRQADALVPMEDEVSSTEEKASLAWGSLIDGKPVSLGKFVNRMQYIQVTLKNLALEMNQIDQSNEVPDMRRIMGLANVIQHTMDIVTTLQDDPGAGSQIKVFSDILAQAMNRVEKLAADYQKQQQDQGNPGMSAQDQAKIQAMLITAQTKAKVAEASAAQKRDHKEIAFQNDQRRKEAALQADIAAKDAETSSSILRDNLTAALTPKSKPSK